MTMGPEFRKYPELLVVCFLSFILFYTTLAQDVLEVQVSAVGKFGETAHINCNINYNKANVTWLFDDKPLEIDNRITQSNGTQKQMNADIGELTYRVYNLTIANVTSQDSGNYTCKAQVHDLEGYAVAFLNLSFPPKYIKGKSRYEFNATHASDENPQVAELECDFEVYKPDKVQWYKKGSNNTISLNSTQLTNRRIHSVYKFDKITNQDNGSYVCEVYYPENDTYVGGELTVIVYDKPNLYLDQVIGISKTELYLNWTVETHNSEILSYTLWYSTPTSDGMLRQYIDETNNKKIAPNSTSLVMNGLKESTVYPIKLQLRTKHGETSVAKNGTTLNIDPEFVPNITINGFSATSVTIGWQPPPKEIEHLIHYYLLEARKIKGGTPRKAYHSKDEKNLPYMFDNLEPFSTYTFRVRACQDFTKTCGNWSKEMQAATLDGIPEEPDQVKIACSVSHLNLTWEQPIKANAEIKGYMVELTGNATFRDRSGAVKKITLGPLAKFLSNDSKVLRFNDLQPNTQYTVRVSAMTRSRRRGAEAGRSCRTLPAPPDQPPRPRWRKILDNNRYLFKLYLPQISERNGPICCYRVYMVRMRRGTDLKDLKPQHQLPVTRYEEAHSVKPTWGAYITDIFTNDNFPNEGDILMGDGRPYFNKSDPIFSSESCKRCLYKPERDYEPPPPPPKPTTTSTTTEEDDSDDFIPTEESVNTPDRRRRSSDNDYANDAIMQNPQKLAIPRPEEVAVVDGALDSRSNYTMFVELIPGTIQDEPMFSDYANVLIPAPTQVAPAPSSTFEIALQATCAVAALVLLLMIIFCVLQSRRSRKMPPHAHVEMNPIQAALRYVVGHMGGRQQLLPLTPAEMPPIPEDQLAAAYIERHADTDLGFQKEFELLQRHSEYISDRTTQASEARENQPKNRYPDIKAYDQTRVKLSQIDGITGSDYINANYVMGYKERKKFICAQGPTDTTVNDFWRMIWEHGLELIVMLTNLEEYSKVKCSKYWPDAGSRAFGSVTVTHLSETRYSDYIVRELKITKQPINPEGQPIIENNGVAKRNGDINNTTDSAPTSPRDKQGETRTVRQYHFLMWKDFAAPEHPHSILKFIKRVNEAWSNMIGRPLVVHCSAGVGRTGTLVALDCLLESLRQTRQAAVYNTVAELRRHRNYLVQSQKQYIFVYRALVEFAHYGDTEIQASKLNTSYYRLKNTPEGADKCLMEYEFEKLIEPPVVDCIKSCAAGEAEEVRTKNRLPHCLPHDRHRVMLAPLPGRDYSTYINASFIEAYDNTEGYIITQDPLPNTIFDFWRMVSEQGINTIVMLSEIGEGKCPRYWEDGTAQYEHISVQYEESESCPYYTRRQFRVTNTKNGSVSVVRQMQYQGWPTAAGAVPEVTRGLADLADAARELPLLVHCHTGTERSALFVALCILISQLRTERRVDVSTVARKIRTQRANVIDTITQYEFLYRAILNYAELHNLLEDS